MAMIIKNGIKYSGSKEAIDEISLSSTISQEWYESNFGLPETPGPEIIHEDFIFSKKIKRKIVIVLSIIFGLPISFIIFINILELLLFLLINLA